MAKQQLNVAYFIDYLKDKWDMCQQPDLEGELGQFLQNHFGSHKGKNAKDELVSHLIKETNAEMDDIHTFMENMETKNTAKIKDICTTNNTYELARHNHGYGGKRKKKRKTKRKKRRKTKRKTKRRKRRRKR